MDKSTEASHHYGLQSSVYNAFHAAQVYILWRLDFEDFAEKSL